MNTAEKHDIHSSKDHPGRKKSILVVEDNMDCLALNQLILEMSGYQVFTALSGKDAVAVLNTINEPGLILLDMQLGDMTAIELLEILEKQKPDIVEKVPIVFLTGMDHVPSSKARCFLRKPIDKALLLATVHRFIEEGTGQAPSETLIV